MDIALNLSDVEALVELAARAPKSVTETRYLAGLVKQINLKAKLVEVPPPTITPDDPPPAPEPVLQS